MQQATRKSTSGQQRVNKQKENEKLARKVEENADKDNRKNMRFEETRGEKRGEQGRVGDDQSFKRGRSPTASASLSSSSCGQCQHW